MNDMVWEMTKRCWELATEAFPEEKGVFVDIPPRLAGHGAFKVCSSGGKELGQISYASSVVGDEPFFLLSLKDKKAHVNIPKFAGMEFPAVRHIDGAKIVERYGDYAPTQIASLARSAKVEMTKAHVSRWLLTNGFAGCDSGSVFSHLGIKESGQKKFEDMEKVRIDNPLSMEHQEGARIVKHKKIDGDFVYLVLVDGSSTPKWFEEKHLSKNTVGEVPYRTSLPRTNGE